MRVPKTGSSTLFHAINSQTSSRYFVHPGHIDTRYFSIDCIKNYDFYAFYRDPYTRFISSWQTTLQGIERNFYKSPLGVIDQIKSLTGNYSLTINNVTSELIKNISIENIITFLRKKNYKKNEFFSYQRYEFFSYQKYFYLPNTVLFDYANYEFNVRTLLDKIGLDSTVKLKILSASNSPHVYDTITNDEKKMIIEYYEPDYEYFASRNIYFNV